MGAAAESPATDGENQAPDKKDAAVQGELVYVTKIQAPFAMLQGDALPVTVSGNLPTPAWKLSGIDVAVTTGRLQQILLTPRALPPGEDVMSIQMLSPFTTKTEVRGLSAGAYALVAQSRDKSSPSERVQVLPDATIVFVRTSGGIAAMERSILVTKDRHARMESSRAAQPVEKDLDDATFVELMRLLTALGPDGRTALSPQGADMRSYWLAWTSSPPLTLTCVDDGTVNEAERAVMRCLDGVFSP